MAKHESRLEHERQTYKTMVLSKGLIAPKKL